MFFNSRDIVTYNSIEPCINYFDQRTKDLLGNDRKIAGLRYWHRYRVSSVQIVKFLSYPDFVVLMFWHFSVILNLVMLEIKNPSTLFLQQLPSRKQPKLVTKLPDDWEKELKILISSSEMKLLKLQAMLSKYVFEKSLNMLSIFYLIKPSFHNVTFLKPFLVPSATWNCGRLGSHGKISRAEHFQVSESWTRRPPFSSYRTTSQHTWKQGIYCGNHVWVFQCSWSLHCRSGCLSSCCFMDIKAVRRANSYWNCYRQWWWCHTRDSCGESLSY